MADPTRPEPTPRDVEVAREIREAGFSSRTPLEAAIALARYREEIEGPLVRETSRLEGSLADWQESAHAKDEIVAEVEAVAARNLLLTEERDYARQSEERLREALRELLIVERVAPSERKGWPTHVERVKAYANARALLAPAGGPDSAPPAYDRNFGDALLCVCGHECYRHFDSYDGMRPVGCKYCPCATWVAPPAAERGTEEVKPRCGGCGGPHAFDTSVPSVAWNDVIRRTGLSDYLCATCILRAFAKIGRSFTAVLTGDGLPQVPIEVRVGGQAADDANRVQEENNRLRSMLGEIYRQAGATLDAATAPPPAPVPVERSKLCSRCGVFSGAVGWAACRGLCPECFCTDAAPEAAQAPNPAPRYDDVYEQGVAWLDAQARGEETGGGEER